MYVTFVKIQNRHTHTTHLKKDNKMKFFFMNVGNEKEICEQINLFIYELIFYTYKIIQAF